MLSFVTLSTIHTPEQKAYVVHWITHPDKGSKFEKKTKYLSWLPGFLLIWLMSRLGYDGMLFYQDEHLIGHIFFQKYFDQWKMFSIFVDDKFRHRGHSTTMTQLFIMLAHEKHVSRIQLGNGGNERVSHLWRQAGNNLLFLPCDLEFGPTDGSLVIKP